VSAERPSGAAPGGRAEEGFADWSERGVRGDQSERSERRPPETEDDAEAAAAARSRLLKRIRKIEIITEHLVRDRMAGQYHSVFKGRGIAFSEVRQYMPGDDIRLIDWNVSARMNDVYVKLYTEEREMTVLLLVDMSASGRFGSREQEKRELAAELAAILAFSAIRNNDRVGLVIFTDRVERFVPPKKGKKHVLRVVSEILAFRPAHRQTNIGAGLQFLGRIARRRAVAFVISDFLAPLDGYERALRITAGRHDLIPVTITDPLEEKLPPVGLLTLEDPETGELVVFDTAGREARAWEAEAAEAVAAREALFKRLDMDPIRVRTDRPYLPGLTAFFEARARRLRH
jgi:uncharacterized protein (DUF58 family)